MEPSGPGLRALAALAEGFVAGGGAERAARAWATLSRVGDPGAVTRLRVLLRLLEGRAGPLLMGGIARPLHRMSEEERERFLRRWLAHPVPFLRSGGEALRKLLTFLAWADAEEPADPFVRARLSGTGYAPPRIPSASVAPVLRAWDPGDRGLLEADVLVVGSGAGGGLAARELARAGRDVLLVEQGPLRTEADFPEREGDAFRALYLDEGATSTVDGRFTILAGATVGGGTTVNWLTCFPTPEGVRHEWERVHGVDGMAGPEGDRDLHDTMQELDPVESVDVPPKDAAILRGAAVLGWRAGRLLLNRGACGDCGSCGFGCRAGSKRSTLRLHIPEAVEQGARLLPGCRVERLEIDGGRVSGARATLATPTGGRREIRIRARQVVVSAGALRTPALLEQSGIRHPGLGRYLRLHPVVVSAGVFADPVRSWSGTQQAAWCGEFAEPRGPEGGFVIEAAPGHPGLIAQGIPWLGRTDHAHRMARAAHIAPLLALLREEGSGEVRALEGGRVRIRWRGTARDHRRLEHAGAMLGHLLRAAGAEEVLRVEGPLSSAHPMGSARMGADPALHPVDPRGRVRGDRPGRPIRGLYVADSSLFPTALGVNPQVTVYAMARRVVRTILAESPSAGLS